MRMRTLFLVVAAAVLVPVGLALAKPSASTAPSLQGACAKANLSLQHPGQLTIGTDNPAYPPYFDGHELKSTGFKVSNPYSGKGFESAVAYAVAGQLGFTHAQVKWIVVHFVNSYAPGKKPFDFYLAQVSYSPVRAKVVDFSNGYFDLNQAVVALTSNKYASVKTIAALRGAKLGAPLGTTSYGYIVKYIKPTQKPSVYKSLNDALAGLKAKQIDGVVVDFPTAYYIANVQLSGAKIIGRLPTRGTNEHFGLVLQKGSSLRTCVNKALANLKANGTLARIERTWISSKARAPFLH
jgi:polar amino acid transport system substrate-binding protein